MPMVWTTSPPPPCPLPELLLDSSDTSFAFVIFFLLIFQIILLDKKLNRGGAEAQRYICCSVCCRIRGADILYSHQGHRDSKFHSVMCTKFSFAPLRLSGFMYLNVNIIALLQ